jgi:hypothetical protein
LDRERDSEKSTDSHVVCHYSTRIFPNNPEGTGETPLSDLFSDSPPTLVRTSVLLCDHPVLISFGHVSVLVIILSCSVFTGREKGNLYGAFTWYMYRYVLGAGKKNLKMTFYGNDL